MLWPIVVVVVMALGAFRYARWRDKVEAQKLHTGNPPVEPSLLDAAPAAGDTGILPRSFYNLKTAGDFLRLVGMRVSLGTRGDGFYDGEMVDLDDLGTHVLLKGVTHLSVGQPTEELDRARVPIAEIDFVEV
jgi:hypothetical protein